MKTSYKDFIVWNLKFTFTEAYDKHKYEDELIEIGRNFFEELRFDRIYKVSDYIDYCLKNNLNELLNNKDTYTSGVVHHPFFSVRLKFDFFFHLLKTCKEAGWVDIENEFYDQLTAILKGTTSKSSSLMLLNESMKNLISFLEMYLLQIHPPAQIKAYLDIFDASIKKDEIVTVQLTKDVMPTDTQVLNFNYTPVIENYFEKAMPMYSNINYEVNYIHGKAGDPTNPLIFGFGDELDDSYLKMELEKSSGFLTYIKSFWYFKTSNYHNLIRFIDSDDFQVYVMGHSCGLSDRTMLNMVFEHDNCKSIKIFYHENKDGRNNFTALTQQISRHFKNKGMMRKKIVSFDKSTAMPQA
ncbi:AbiH family protein [Mucilaginibacter sp. UYCu711]|uniref:AbiH family protein n=1 Tax=Mucilaginibacter sp. UYCu711 TaxID=3156339 RepID=UPI003D1F11B0